jgi:hypothetical protein
MKTYRHSKVFEVLKATDEVISDNLTSLQYLQTLDLFLWRALEPIHAECPSLFHNYLAKIVATQTNKPSTKFTSMMAEERPKLPVLLFNAVTAVEPKKSHAFVRDMHINRGLLFGLISLFLNSLRPYEELHQPSNMNPIIRRSKMNAIERSIGLRKSASLYAVIQQVRYWYEKARWFKELIMQKYIRLALNHARTTYKDYNHFVELDDVAQTYLVTVSRSIDRCDSRQGVLTTFITNWFKSARSEVAELAKGQSDQSYDALTEDNGDSVSDLIGFAMPDTSRETIEHVAYVAKKMDPHGYVRASLGIPEFLTDAQLRTLKTFVLESRHAGTIT